MNPGHRITRLLRHRRGIAIPMVVVFLAIIAVVAISTSYQSSFVRKSTGRSFYGFEATEVCESAINEAAAKVTLRDVFPQSDFPQFEPFFFLIAQENEAGLKAAYPNYQFFFRDVTNSSTNTVVGRIFCSMSWPTNKRPTKANNLGGFMKSYTVTNTKNHAQTLHGFKSISDVKMSVLSWRRDFAGVQWQDWGVLHFEVTVEFDDGKTKAKRTMHTDRMFSLYVHSVNTYPQGQPGDDPSEPIIGPGTPPDDPVFYRLFVHYIQSRSNLRTVILRS